MDSYILIVMVNSAPVISVLLLGWEAFPLLVLYWLENVVIGVITLLKMIAAAASKGVWSAVSGLFLCAFFVFHYGIFCAAHGGIMWEIFGGGDGDPTKLPGAVYAFLWENPYLAANLALFASYHLYAFVRYFLITGEYRSADPNHVMFSPYGRIVIIHLTILLGGYAVVTFGQPVITVAVLALLKTGLEVVIGLPPRESGASLNKASGAVPVP